jgi:hypothetical protein
LATSLGMGEVHNALQLVVFELGIHSPYTFIRVSGMILLDKAIRKYLCNLFIFNVSQLIVIPIEWWIEHAQLNDLRIREL